MSTRIIVKGHKLKKKYCYDTVSHKTAWECECGKSGVANTGFRARLAHIEHKANVVAQAKNRAREW